MTICTYLVLLYLEFLLCVDINCINWPYKKDTVNRKAKFDVHQSPLTFTFVTKSIDKFLIHKYGFPDKISNYPNLREKIGYSQRN